MSNAVTKPSFSVARYITLESRLNAAATGPLPVGNICSILACEASTIVIVAPASLRTNSSPPSGLRTSPFGFAPISIWARIEREATSATEIFSSPVSATKTSEPSGETTRGPGVFPTLTDPRTLGGLVLTKNRRSPAGPLAIRVLPSGVIARCARFGITLNRLISANVLQSTKTIWPACGFSK